MKHVLSSAVAAEEAEAQRAPGVLTPPQAIRRARRRRGFQPRGWQITAAAVSLVLLAGTVAGWFQYKQQGTDLQSVQTHLTAAEAELKLADGMMHGLTPVTPPEEIKQVSDHFTQARAQLVMARQELKRDQTLAFLGNVDFVRKQLDAVYSFVQIGLDAISAGEQAISVVSQLHVLSISDPGLSPTERVYKLAQQSRPQLEAAAAAIRDAQKTRARVDEKALLPQLRAKLPSIDKSLAQAANLITSYDEGMKVILPALGQESPKHYLLLFADTAEIRGSGGLYGSVGLLNYDKGKQAPIAITDVYVVEAPIAHGIKQPNGTLKFVDPPPPIAKITPGWSDNIINSGWSPDFPSAAQRAEMFYQASTGQAVDGVVSIDQVAAQELLAATGPVAVPGYNVTISSDNLLKETVKRIELQPRPGEQRKTFLSVLARAEMDRLVHLEPEHWPLAVKQMQLALAGRHIQVFANAKDTESFAAKMNASGSLLETANDSIGVVDNQLWPTKVATFVDRTFADKVTLSSNGTAKHELSLTYKNNGDPKDTRVFGGVFENYLRVYVPKGAKLVGQTGYTHDFQQAEDAGAAVFQGYVNVDAQKTVTVTLTYTVPVQKGTSAKQYQLFWRKQAGVISYPLSVTVTENGKTLAPAWKSTPAAATPATIAKDENFGWKR